MKSQRLLSATARTKSRVLRTKPANLTVRYTEKRSGISPARNNLVAAKLAPQSEKRTPRCLCDPVP
ncbi:hypothetical protein EIZ48_27700 [Photobacterium alginatilyticum]|uniref:Uncharacterized protein n=1 Tax=Photobacterium alginatilyticum TaxID=1775171 RepID=A0ABW9YQV1_9GAMM|nr:hypothetical protein [Photobacterium alginatilyticum]